MTEVGKFGKAMGIPRARDLKRLPAEPERATPARKQSHPTKQYGIEYQYNSRWAFFKKNRSHHKWFKTKNARDQSLACMRREIHAGVDFYVNLKAIDP